MTRQLVAASASLAGSSRSACLATSSKQVLSPQVSQHHSTILAVRLLVRTYAICLTSVACHCWLLPCCLLPLQALPTCLCIFVVMKTMGRVFYNYNAFKKRLLCAVLIKPDQPMHDNFRIDTRREAAKKGGKGGKGA